MQADDTTRIRPQIRIVPEEYDAFVRLIADERLPRTHEEWLSRCARIEAEYDARGQESQKVVIHSEEFAYYCQSRGREPSYELLEELAAEKRGRVS